MAERSSSRRTGLVRCWETPSRRLRSISPGISPEVKSRITASENVGVCWIRSANAKPSISRHVNVGHDQGERVLGFKPCCISDSACWPPTAAVGFIPQRETILERMLRLVALSSTSKHSQTGQRGCRETVDCEMPAGQSLNKP